MSWNAMLGLALAVGVTAGLTAGATAEATAADKKMYRCGNVFQERPCEGPKPAPVKVDATKQEGPSQATLDSRKQIRCENFQRQVTELQGREKTEKNAQLLKGWVGQRNVLEDRMKADNC